MKILVVNDDGYKCRGIRVLAKKLSEKHDVTVVSPDKSRSGFSRSLTFGRCLKYKRKRIDGICYYILNGTPCDCVKFGLSNIVKDADLVVSGINTEANVGTDILYSGTVNSAFEGALLEKPSIAVSVNAKNNYFDDVATFISDNLNELSGLSKGLLVPTINFPSEYKSEWKNVKLTTVGNRKYNDWYKKAKNGYLLNGFPLNLPNDENSDVVAINEGYISITITTVSFAYSDCKNSDEFLERLCW